MSFSQHISQCGICQSKDTGFAGIPIELIQNFAALCRKGGQRDLIVPLSAGFINYSIDPPQIHISCYKKGCVVKKRIT